MDTQDFLKHPLVLLVLVLLVIVLALKVIGGIIKYAWLILVVGVVLYFVSPAFKAGVHRFFDRITRN